MTNPIPEGCEGLIPHLITKDSNGAIDFCKKAFGAEEICRMPAPGGDKIMHAEINVAGAKIFIADDFPEFCGGKERAPSALGGTPVTIHRYVKDVDAVMAKAEQAGATVTMPAQDMFWGDRYGVLEDPFGHTWSFATHVKDMTPEEMDEAAKKAFGG